MKRVLLLHGFTQNSAIIEDKFSKTIEMLNKKEKLEWIIPDAPVILDEKNNSRAWYYCNKTNPLDYKPYFEVSISKWIDFEESIELLKKYSEIDILIGFSQGAQVAHYLVYNNIIVPQKIILISGFVQPWYTQYNTKKINILNLHIFGTLDNIILNNKSEYLSQQYTNPKFLIHKKHHIVGFSKDINDIILDWLL